MKISRLSSPAKRALLLACTTLLPSTTYAFTNPIKPLNGSDPHMTYHNGMYYLTSTSWFDVQLTAASTIEGLKTAKPVTLYADRSDPRRARNWWAPEMHFLDGRWYVYFTTSIDDPDWGVMLPTLSQWVLGGPTTDPLDGDWELVGGVRPENYHSGMLDGTVYEIDGQNYFIYSAINGPESPNGASLWISKLLSPTSISNATMIAFPELSWEKSSSAVLEGPQGIRSPVTGELYMVYSADDCNNPAYKLGALKLKKRSSSSSTPADDCEFADPMLPESWEKLAHPLLETDPLLNIFGPGHNGFFKSPDGTQDWIAYHANANASGRCNDYRQTFVQQVFWEEDGTPKLSPPVAAGVEIGEPSSGGY